MESFVSLFRMHWDQNLPLTPPGRGTDRRGARRGPGAALRTHVSGTKLGGATMSRLVTTFLCLFALARTIHGQTTLDLRVPVEGQPLSANITRVLQALRFLGTPLLSAR